MHADTSTQLLKEQQAAGVMQRRMLPATPAKFAGFTLAYELYGAGELSGDFVDFVALSAHRVAFLVADVAGHGASAALVTVALKSFIARAPDQAQPTPAALLRQLNTELLAVDLDRHVCALIGVIDLDTNGVRLASAGVFPQPLFSGACLKSGSTPEKDAQTSKNESATSLEIAGKALGLFDLSDYTEYALSFAVGDRLTVVTDGILEWLADPSLDDKERRLATAAAAPVDQFWSTLGVTPDAGGIDDVTWFTLERHA